MVIERAVERLSDKADAAGLAAFRILFGGIMAFAVLRFWANGWIETIYLEPAFHFTYAWFPWVQPLPSLGLHVIFAIIGASALCIALGLWTRFAAAIFFLLFTYAELIEKAAYLNHYYLVSLLAFLLIFLPSDRLWALRQSARRPNEEVIHLGVYWLLRLQIGLVYVFAGLSKLNADWLLRAEPLRTWLQGHLHLPLVGPILADETTAFVMSWTGAFFDLTIWGWLLWSRSRHLALFVAAAFHIVVWCLFPIGIFSWIMLLSITVFLPPDWPRFLTGVVGGHRCPLKKEGQVPATRLPFHRAALFAGTVWIILQIAVPLRSHLNPGNVNWHEDGFRFSWRVMLIEKTGMIEYRIETERPTRRYRVNPRERLSPLQFKMLATQPDMIIQYARHLAQEFRERGHSSVAVYADSHISFNGRLSQEYVDPRLDLSDPRVTASGAVLPLGAGL